MQSPQNLSLKITNIPYEVLYEILMKTCPNDINNYCSTSLTIYGKIVLLRDGKISNIDTGQSVGYIAAGRKFMIVITMDSKLNYFLYSSIIDSTKG